MYYPSKKEFVSLSSSGNVIPVYREMLADFDTPISAFIKMDGGQYAYLLESVEGGENLGRFSFLGSDPHIIIESKGDKVTVTKNGSAKTHHIKKDPLDEIKSIMKSYKFVHLENLPRFCGGLVGYIGYDAVRFIERIPDKNPDEINAPDMLFMFTDTIIIFDHVARRVKVVANAVVDGDAEEAYDKACLRIDGMVERLKRVSVIPEVKTVEGSQPEVESNFSEKDFCSIVESAKEHIKAGDIIQIVLSQRLKRKTRVDAFSIYRALRSINPSPYMFFLKFRDFRIVGSSPEILVRYENGQVEVRPIAGTRRRGEDR
ncbi:MAG TPA: chorismate-binding protein, partial [Candidatus Omnitrophota bacterium]|nr:chorismate-binding protein [Candidatus Omnitrophota bacterium]